MNKFTILFSLLSALFFSCSEDSQPLEACKTDNALVELSWLAELIEENEKSEIGTNYSFISKGSYRLKTVFILQNCCPNCSSIFPVYDCNGDALGYLGPDGINYDDIRNVIVIWKSSKNSCNFSD